MKKVLHLLSLALSLSIMNISFSQSLQENLTGKWQLISTSGGITGKGFPIKNKLVIEFREDCKYLGFEQDSLKFVKTYHLVNSESKYRKKDSMNLLFIGNGNYGKYEFRLNKNSLILREPYADGFTKVYARILPEK